MELLTNHIVLATGSSCEESRTQVLNFFKNSSLVRYDKIIIANDQGLGATELSFEKELQRGLGMNREILDGFIRDFEAGTPGSHFELARVSQGYPSKILHIIAHFLDGFIGIDSAFYNLVDDSHWLPEDTATLIKENPGKFWLFSLDCYSMSPREAALLHM